MKIALAISILAMAASAVSIACSLVCLVNVWTMKRQELEERVFQRDLDSLHMITKDVEPDRDVSPAASLVRVGPFTTPEEAQKHHERNYAALNGCLKAIEAAGLTSEEAQTIPAQLEKAVAFESVQQLHSAAFNAFEISREPDGRGGWKDKPEGYSYFTAYGN